MKINGRTFHKPNEQVLVIPRDGFDIVFRARAILDDKDFEKICPQPNPPAVSYPGGSTGFNYDDEDYKTAISSWNRRRIAWQVIKSLEATDGLEWSTVKLNDPNTWENWEPDLRAAFFSDREVALILQVVLGVNTMTNTMLEEARQRFLASQAQTPQVQ